jgi:hypothetical protein
VQLLLQWKSNEYYTICVCICSPKYPACNAPFCHLWPLPLFYIFPHYLTNGTIFEKKKSYLALKRVSSFPTTFVWNIFHSKNNWARYDKKMCLGYHVKYPLFLSDFNETCIFSKDFQKMFKHQISWKSVQWRPSCSMRTDRRTDRHDEANSSL